MIEPRPLPERRVPAANLGFMADPASNPSLLAQGLTALVSGVIGGFIGSGLKWVEQRFDRRRRRRSIATALLNDLRTVELNARLLMDMDYAARSVSLPTSQLGPILRRVAASDDLLLFSPDTVSRLHYLASLLHNVENIGKVYPKVGEVDRALLNREVRNKSYFVAQSVAATKRALQDDGGSLPPADAIQLLEGAARPELGPPAFKEWTVPSHERKMVWVSETGETREPDPDGGLPERPK